MNKKLVRITTVPISLEKLLSGQLHFMNSYYHVIGISSDLQNLERVKIKEGIEVYPIEMTRKITPVKDFVAVVQLYIYLKKIKPFIVHTHTPKAGIVGMIAAKLARVPNRLHTVAGLPLLEAKGIKRKVLNFVERITYASATKIYPNSKGLLEIIIENKFCKEEKVKVLANGSSNGIDTAYFDPSLYETNQKLALKNQLGINEDDFVFIFVGRLVKDKGINELIKAFCKLQSIDTSVKLLLVGDYENDLDPLDNDTMNTISMNGSIITTGFQYDVRPYFSVSDCLVFPTYREGFPNVVMQAGAMMLPCIVTNINGCNEIIIEANNGLIIPVKNEEAIHESMKRMVTDATLFHHMRNNSRNMIISRYEQKVVWKALLNEYQSLEK